MSIWKLLDRTVAFCHHVFVAAILTAMCDPVVAADWPTYRADAARSGYTSESLALPLELHWSHRPSAAPRPAWPRDPRMQFDRAFQVVSAGDRVVFGSSVTGVITALDLTSGDVAWTYFTDGPIRFAPAIWQGRVFAASDDGHLHVLSLADGSLLWKHRGGPSSESVLGNESMISKWPARGGPAVVDGVVYYAAGIWPSEGIYLYALDAGTGGLVWCNADSGAIAMPQPHGGANAKSGVSAQGYLVVCEDRVLVPTGRAVPAAFDRQTGKLLYFHLQQYGQVGGSPIMATGGLFFNGGWAFEVGSGQKLPRPFKGWIGATGDGIVQAAGTAVTGYRWDDTVRPDRKGVITRTQEPAAEWSAADLPTAVTVITAGRHLVLGCDGRVCVLDMSERKRVWEVPLEGTADGLAVANGRLLVSTDRGAISCFAPGPFESVRATHDFADEPADVRATGLADVAKEILERSGVTRGYCLDLGCVDGSLAYELAIRSELRIIAVDGDAENVRRAREMLSAAGLYGTRVTVQQRDPASTGYPAYFADLIVSQRAASGEDHALARQEAARLQRPCGGAICMGTPGNMSVSVRGALEGSGHWTHQYADPANTVNSDDAMVKGTLGMLWYREIDFGMPSRHGRAPAPLATDGRLYQAGMDGIIAVDAYNGRELWRCDIPRLLRAYDGDELMGVAGTGSNYCLGGDSVFVRDQQRCLRLHAASGELIREFPTPENQDGTRSPWGYIAWDNGCLFGSTANEEHIATYRYVKSSGDMTKQLTESRSLFRTDPESGNLVWRYDAKDSIRHNAIAIADGKVFLIDRPLALFDRVKEPASREHATGTLVALDARTGGLLWSTDREIYGTMLAASVRHGVLLMSYQPTRFRLDSELGGRMAAFRLDSGERLWDREAKYESRPMLNDRTIYAQGGAWDLLTGEPVEFEFQRSYGCGILCSSKQMLLFRSATLGYYDLAGARETENYGGIRPGCWINALPVGGVVLLPDATAGCECSYLNKAWIALEPTTGPVGP